MVILTSPTEPDRTTDGRAGGQGSGNISRSAATEGGSASPPQAPEREALAGLVERVTFHHPDNGFCVLRVKAPGQRDLVTLVGAAAAITAGEFVQASGTWLNNRVHGLQ